MIKLDRVSKSWGTTKAVDEISFSIEPGQFVILLGPSGCGKSTTLRMIAGLEEASQGNITIADRNVTYLPPGDRGLSMVFQSYALFPHLSVADNIVFGLRSRKVPKHERQQRLTRVAELVDLTEYLARKPAQLSGGQRQRVALARAIISEHPICLMDEPLSNLDARLRSEMRREIKALQARFGMTVIYVTHDQVEAMSMGDRVILMKDGKVVQDAPPDELYRCPQTTFAASFIGSPAMNLLALEPHPQGAALSGEPRIAVAGKQAASGMLGVRPEDVHVHQDLSASGLPATVLDSEYLGADTILRCQIGQQTLSARLAGQHFLPVGQQYCLGWQPDAAHVFGTDGQRRDDIQRFPFSASPHAAQGPMGANAP